MIVHVPSLFEDLYESYKRGELILKEGGICQYHRSRRDPSIVTIYVILSTRPGLGKEILNEIKSLPGVGVIKATCPEDLDANRWYEKSGFKRVGVKAARSGRRLVLWELRLDSGGETTCSRLEGENTMGLSVLKALRLERGMTLKRLQELSGVHFTEISLIERGLWKPSSRTLEKLAGVLEVDPRDLTKPYADWVREHGHSQE